MDRDLERDHEGWTGVVFMYEPSPVVVLVFEGEAHARHLFDAWRGRYGDVDDADAIRVSIVEGELPGLGPGYSVHVHEGGVSRVLRTSSEVLVKRLSLLKGAFDHWREVRLEAGVRAEGEPIVALVEGVGLRKRHLHFRRAEEILPGDPDGAVLERG